MLPKVRNTATAAIAALALATAGAAPAHALSNKDKDILKGLAAAAIVGAVIMNNRGSSPAATQRYTQPQYQTPQYQTPQYQAPRQTYQTPASYQQPTYQQPYQSSIHSTAAAQAFSRLSASERRLLQSRLAGLGYYHGGVDGAYGPVTHRAITAYAGDTLGTDQLSTVASAYDFYGRIIR